MGGSSDGVAKTRAPIATRGGWGPRQVCDRPVGGERQGGREQRLSAGVLLARGAPVSSVDASGTCGCAQRPAQLERRAKPAGATRVDAGEAHRADGLTSRLGPRAAERNHDLLRPWAASSQGKREFLKSGDSASEDGKEGRADSSARLPAPWHPCSRAPFLAAPLARTTTGTVRTQCRLPRATASGPPERAIPSPRPAPTSNRAMTGGSRGPKTSRRHRMIRTPFRVLVALVAFAGALPVSAEDYQCKDTNGCVATIFQDGKARNVLFRKGDIVSTASGWVVDPAEGWVRIPKGGGGARN